MSVYIDYGIQVDSDDRPADDMESTIAKWKDYLENSGVSVTSEKDRFVLISPSPDKYRGCGFCKRYTSVDELLRDENRLSQRWTRLQHFTPMDGIVFRRYLEAFTASAKDCLRIYDPYLSKVFNAVDSGESRTRDWRDSFAFLMRILLRNKRISCFDFMTCFTEDQVNGSSKLFLNEVIELLFSLSELSERSTGVKVCFHFMEKPRSFHDRFLANGRYVFAIGHGCDICIASDFKGKCVSTQQWKQISRRGEEIFRDFNVFYGCSKYDAPKGIVVFNERTPVNNKGESPLYPKNCYSRNFESVKDRFIFGKYDFSSSSCTVTDRLSVCVNPLNCPDDF